MAAALRVHDAIVRDAIERHGGYVFATDGDGFCAAFSTAAERGRGRGRGAAQLRADTAIGFAVRMGLHTGEAIERDGDYFGSEVNRAARLMALAHGGQVLVSDTDRGAAAQPPVATAARRAPAPRAARAGSRCTRSSPTVSRPRFPVLRSVERFAGNLPRQVTSLVGRDDLVAEVAELVRDRHWSR